MEDRGRDDDPAEELETGQLARSDAFAGGRPRDPEFPRCLLDGVRALRTSFVHAHPGTHAPDGRDSWIGREVLVHLASQRGFGRP